MAALGLGLGSLWRMLYAVSERQMLLFFAEGLVGVDKHLFQRVSFI